MIKDQDKSAYGIKFVIVSTGLALVGGTVGDLAPQREQENADIGQPHKDTPGRKANLPRSHSTPGSTHRSLRKAQNTKGSQRAAL